MIIREKSEKYLAVDKVPIKKRYSTHSNNCFSRHHATQNEQQIAVMARAFVTATFPHSRPDGLFFHRKNGRYTLTMLAHPKYGLPYGALARLLLVWITTEASAKNSAEICLGKSLSDFLKKLSLRNIGGVRGSAARVKEQLIRLITCSISYNYHDKKKGICTHEQFHISQSFKLLWNPAETEDADLKTGSKIVLAKDFFDELINHPVPINFNALNSLRRSPLQIDLYIWLTYRFYKLKEEVFIPWPLMMEQLGADYAHNAEGLRNFKKKFFQALKKVCVVYPEANVSFLSKGIFLGKSNTHIKKNGDQPNNPVDKSKLSTLKRNRLCEKK